MEDVKGIEVKPWWKKIFRWLLWVFLSLLLLVGGVIALAFVYEDEVKAAVLEELNQHLNAEVKIDPQNIDFTIIKTFPKAALEFKNLMAYEALQKKERDTLCQAAYIGLEFDWYDLFSKNYKIRRIIIKNAKLNLQVDKQGKENYIFWKQTPTEKQAAVEFKLDETVFENVYLSYKNKKEWTKVQLRIDKTVFSGAFSEEEYLLTSKGSLRLENLIYAKKGYLFKKRINFEIDAQIAGKTYRFKKAKAKINQLQLDLSGKLERLDSALMADMEIKGTNVDIASALSLLPEAQQEKLNGYQSEGLFYARAKLNGNLSHADELEIDAAFGVEKARINHRETKISISQLNLSGTYQVKKKQAGKLDLKNIMTEVNGKKLTGDFAITFFKDPYIVLNTTGSLELQEWKKIYPLDTIANINGLLNFQAEVRGYLSALKSGTRNQDNQLSAKIALKEGAIRFKGDPFPYQLNNTYVHCSGNTVFIDSLDLKYGKSDASISGKAENCWAPFFKKKEVLALDIKVNAGMLSIDELLGAGSGSGQRMELEISEAFDLQFHLYVKKAEFHKFLAKNLAGSIKLKDKKLFTENLSLETMDGDLALKGMIDASDERFVFIRGNGNLVSIDVQQLFTQLNNFGQTAIQDKHLRGIATTTIDFSTKWTKSLECILPEVKIGADLTIEKGELIDYKPLESLSKYVDLKELQRIKFSTLQSHIDIKDQNIFISQTTIKNTAMNMEFYGTHKFDNTIDYHIKLALSEVLAKRPGKNRQLDEELALVENDPENRRSVFLTMRGSLDDPKISYDRKGLKEKVKNDIQQEKQNLKQLLKEEFGLFKKDKDSDSEKKDKSKSNQKFEVGFLKDKAEVKEDKERTKTTVKKNKTKSEEEKAEEEEDDF